MVVIKGYAFKQLTGEDIELCGCDISCGCDNTCGCDDSCGCDYDDFDPTPGDCGCDD